MPIRYSGETLAIDAPCLSTDSFDAFCQAQQRRIAQRLGDRWARRQRARREALKEAQLRWEIRGRVAGHIGTVRHPYDDEDA